MKKILVACTHQEILNTILRLINKKTEWHAEGAINMQAVFDRAASEPFDVLLLGSGLTEKEEEMLCITFHNRMKCVKHYGGGSGLLYTEIQQALDQTDY